MDVASIATELFKTIEGDLERSVARGSQAGYIELDLARYGYRRIVVQNGIDALDLAAPLRKAIEDLVSARFSSRKLPVMLPGNQYFGEGPNLMVGLSESFDLKAAHSKTVAAMVSLIC